MTNPNPWSVKSKTFGRQCWLGIFIDCSLSFNEQIPKVNWLILIPDTQNTKSFIQFCIVQKIKLETNNQLWLVPDIINNKLFTRYDTYVEFSRGISVMMIAVGILGLIGNITAIIVLSRWIVCTRFDLRF